MKILSSHDLRRIGMALLLTVVCGTSMAIDAPTGVVRQAVGQIIDVLKRKDASHTEKWSEIGKLIDTHFDFRSMSQSILATRWQAASKAEKRQFVEYLAQYLEVTYREKFEAYTDQRIEYAKETLKKDHAVVDTFIVSNVNRIPVTYKLRLNGEQWIAYDVVIDGLSLVNNFRDTFEAIVKSEGMGGLLRDLEGKIANYKAHHGGHVPADTENHPHP